ncbi:MAG TPA: phosphatase PAP2 family protein [Anaerolinea sp.]|nr:phosphatase PAP2 family protein [Anaerolinea sp.]
MSTKAITTATVQDHPLRKNEFTGLRAPGLLAQNPRIGICLFIFGSLVFGALTYNLLAHGPLIAWDTAIAHTLPAAGLHSPSWVKGVMIAGFYMGKEVVAALTLLFSLYFLYKRYWPELAMMASGWIGSAILFNAFSRLIGRPRPPTQIWIVVNIPGFPSGHAVAVVVFYGLLAYLSVPKIPSAFWKWVVAALALLIIGFVGFSRIFTGGHYLTDVLAGYAVGLAWSGVIYSFIEIYSQRKRRQNVKKEEARSG